MRNRSQVIDQELTTARFSPGLGRDLIATRSRAGGNDDGSIRVQGNSRSRWFDRPLGHPVDYWRPDGASGLYQVNAVVPPGIATGDTVPVTITVAGQTSQPGVTFSVHGARNCPYLDPVPIERM
jgi:hypothetical protein